MSRDCIAQPSGVIDVMYGNVNELVDQTAEWFSFNTISLH